MIRDAIFSDIPALMAIMEDSLQRSKYAGRGHIVQKASEQMFTSMIAAQKQNGPGASFVQVVEKEGKVVGFMAGVLNRVYNIFDKLCAADVFLVNHSGAIKDTLSLIDNYIAWAKRNPKVIEIGLSWSDAIPHSSEIANIYRRKGGHRVGEQFEIRVDMASEEAA